MRRLDVPYPLDSDDVLPVDAGQRRKAGVDAGMVDALGGGVILGDDNGTGAAASF